MMRSLFILFLLFSSHAFANEVKAPAQSLPAEAKAEKADAVPAPVTVPASDTALGMMEQKGIPLAAKKNEIEALLPTAEEAAAKEKAVAAEIKKAEQVAAPPVWKEKPVQKAAPVKYIQPEDFKKNNIYKVWKVYDADSLRLEGDERVVLIGVDAPENTFNQKMFNESRRTKQTLQSLKAAGKIALRHTRALTEGKYVRLVFDEEQRDRHGRLLAYVFLQDGTFLNAELIRSGYARAIESTPNTKYRDLFIAMEAEARTNQRGFWKAAEPAKK